MKKTVVIKSNSSDLTTLLQYNPDDSIYEFHTEIPPTGSIHLAISDDISTLFSIPAEQKIIINSPAPPNSNWYAVTSISQIALMLDFDRHLTINNITIGGSTYAL